MEIFEGGVTSAKGFKASGVFAGLKKARKDMAMIVSECEAVAAGTYTTNKVKAAPVLWDMKLTEQGKARAVVVNSGNANACTGEQGLKDAEEMASYAAGIDWRNRRESRYGEDKEGRRAACPVPFR